MMAKFFFIAHEKGSTFHAQPQTVAYNACSISRRARKISKENWQYEQPIEVIKSPIEMWSDWLSCPD